MALYAFDGTWQDADKQSPHQHTNVRRFVDLYVKERDTEAAVYHSGPGTRYGTIGQAIGGGVGIGADDRLFEAYERLTELYAAGDPVIDVIGFSRGAATAVDFTWYIKRNGIKDPLARGKILESAPKIRFLGLWDTVFATMPTRGLPVWQRQKTQIHERDFLGRLLTLLKVDLDVDLPDIVGKAYHALALDEPRIFFRPARLSDAHEVWFLGVHSDVGGGSANKRLSDITLSWMIDKASENDLQVADVVLDDSARAQIGISDEPQWTNPWRVVRPDDTIHATVAKHWNGRDAFLRSLQVES